VVDDETPAVIHSPVGSDEASEVAQNDSSVNYGSAEKSVDVSAHSPLMSDIMTTRHSSESLSESNVSASPDETVDEWSRSVVVSNVTEDFKMMIEMALELKPIGGGKVVTTRYSKEERKLLCVFEDSSGIQFYSVVYLLALLERNVVRVIYSLSILC